MRAFEGDEEGPHSHPPCRSPIYHPSGQVWDLGGQTSIRPYWRCYYPNTDAIIFVVDSADVERLAIAKQELCAMLEVGADAGRDDGAGSCRRALVNT